MNATNRLALLINDPSNINNKIMNHETSIQPKSQLTFPIQDSSHPSSILPSINAVTAPLVPRRDTSSLKHHRRRHQIDHTPKEQQQQQQTYQPLLNSSTLDDLFRALTLECEQYLAAASSFQNKTYGQMLAKPSAKIQATVESNDEDYENESIKTTCCFNYCLVESYVAYEISFNSDETYSNNNNNSRDTNHSKSSFKRRRFD